MRARCGSGFATACMVLELAFGCSPPTAERPHAPSTRAPSRSIPFDYVGQSWVRVPAQIGNGPATKMMIDTGIGVTLITPEACARAGCVREGSFTGQRMSGQRIVLPMARVPSLTVAGQRVENARVAVFESDGIIHRDLGVEGIAGLDLFRDQPITFDHVAMRIVLENADSLASRYASGTHVGVRVKHEGPATEVYLPVDLGPGGVAEMEVDSGSMDMILDDQFMAPLAIDPDGTTVRREEGHDETGQAYTRRFTRLPRNVPMALAPKLAARKGETVMFQKIIHDGLLGQAFLRTYVVTFDIPRATMIFAP